MDGGYEISSASDDEPMRKLYLLLAQVGYYIELKAYQRIKVPFRFERGENILIESSTVLNNEKDFSKLDQTDRESHHLLGGRPTGLGVHVTEPFF